MRVDLNLAELSYCTKIVRRKAENGGNQLLGGYLDTEAILLSRAPVITSSTDGPRPGPHAFSPRLATATTGDWDWLVRFAKSSTQNKALSHSDPSPIYRLK